MQANIANVECSTDCSDELLMAAYQAGDDAAFAVIYDRYYDCVTGYVTRLLKGVFRNDVDDLVQTTFMDFHVARTHFIPGTTVKKWLMGLAAQRAIDLIRRATAKKRNINENVAFDDEVRASLVSRDSPAEKVTNQDTISRLRDLIHHLPEPEQAAVAVIYLDGCNCQKAAERLDIPLATVKARAKRGVARLQEQMANDR